MATLTPDQQIEYAMPPAIKEQLDRDRKIIESKKPSWSQLQASLIVFLILIIPLGFIGALLDWMKYTSTGEVQYGATMASVFTVAFVVLGTVVWHWFLARRASSRLAMLSYELADDLDDWFRKEHCIFLEDEKLEAVAYDLIHHGAIVFEYVHVVYFITTKSTIWEETAGDDLGNKEVPSSAGLQEAVQKIWAAEVNEAYRRVSHTVDELENMEENSLTLEEQHVITRAQLDLHEIMVLTKKISQFDKMKDEDTQKVLNMLSVMVEELTRIHMNRADAARKELTVLHDVVIERQSQLMNTMKLT